MKGGLSQELISGQPPLGARSTVSVGIFEGVVSVLLDSYTPTETNICVANRSLLAFFGAAQTANDTRIRSDSADT